MTGQAEQQVRESLSERPANIRANLSIEAKYTFDGLFDGALSVGSFNKKGSLFIGKAECEWYWPDAYNELRDAGLLIYRIYEKDNHPKIGGKTKYLDWGITKLGWIVRQDDLQYYDELIKAMNEDEKIR